MNAVPTMPTRNQLAAALKDAIALRGTVADLLAHKGTVVHAIGPDETVYAAIQKMTDCRAGALPVIDGGRLVGIISERDYTRKGILQGHASQDTRVDTLMTSPVFSVGLDTTLGDCMRVVTEHGIRHLPVVAGDAVVGMLSIGDLVRAVVQQQTEVIQSLKSFIGSDYPT